MSRVLLVEDHVMNRLLARELLEHRGHEVVDAHNVLEARLRLTEPPFDVVLLDMTPANLDFARRQIKRARVQKQVTGIVEGTIVDPGHSGGDVAFIERSDLRTPEVVCRVLESMIPLQGEEET